MEKGFLDMINAHKGIIYKVCNLYVENAEDRKDLFQEILLQIWKSYPSFRGVSAIGTWIYRVAINTSVTFVKKNSRHESGRKEFLKFEVPDLVDISDEDESMARLFHAISLLNGLEKSIVLLYLEDKSYEEMSEITGLTKTNIGVRLNRIKIKLSNTLNQ
ncbi:MAG: RNA polymerase sigma factor [Saprospiraceae bacterium]